jgi:hypothetical protein
VVTVTQGWSALTDIVATARTMEVAAMEGEETAGVEKVVAALGVVSMYRPRFESTLGAEADVRL